MERYIKKSFCFRLKPETKIATDENGNYVESYLQINGEFPEVEMTEENSKLLSEQLKEVLISDLNLSADSVEPITLEEYNENRENEITLYDEKEQSGPIN